MFSHPVKKIVLAGLLVGTLDILAAFIDVYIATGKSPLIVLNYIASGIMGKTAFAGGAGMAFLGLLLHFVIAFAFTFLFFWLYSKSNLLSKNLVVTGIIYGVFIWLVMNLMVVPLSNVNHTPLSAMKIQKVLKAVLILIFMIGLPLSFITNNGLKKEEKIN
jgi:uncharacterized membrane protein YagU involved in acid resistance